MAVRNVDHPIREYRHLHQLSLLELSEQIGINSATLHHLERNRGHPVIRKIIAFCERNDIKPSVFFPRSPEI